MTKAELNSHAVHLLALAGVLRVAEHKNGLAIGRSAGHPCQLRMVFHPKTEMWVEHPGKMEGVGVLKMLRRLHVGYDQIFAAFALQPTPPEPSPPPEPDNPAASGATQ